MNKSAKDKYRREISDRIREFGNDLYSKEVIKERKPFNDAANQCLNGPIPTVKGKKINTQNSWGYVLPQIVFNVPKNIQPREIHPPGARLDTISISALVIGNYSDSTIISDPLEHLEFNIIARGIDSSQNKMVSSWHLDRDIGNGTGKSPNEIHPLYHFQYGGRELRLPDGSFIYGSHLVLGSPRIMHFPLDAILGIDFVLSNFFGKQREKYSQTPSYKRYIQDAQKHLWRPYAFALSNLWGSLGATPCSWGHNSSFCPQFIP